MVEKRSGTSTRGGAGTISGWRATCRQQTHPSRGRSAAHGELGPLRAAVAKWGGRPRIGPGGAATGRPGIAPGTPGATTVVTPHMPAVPPGPTTMSAAPTTTGGWGSRVAASLRPSTAFQPHTRSTPAATISTTAAKAVVRETWCKHGVSRKAGRRQAPLPQARVACAHTWHAGVPAQRERRSHQRPRTGWDERIPCSRRGRNSPAIDKLSTPAAAISHNPHASIGTGRSASAGGGARQSHTQVNATR